MLKMQIVHAETLFLACTIECAICPNRIQHFYPIEYGFSLPERKSHDDN